MIAISWNSTFMNGKLTNESFKLPTELEGDTRVLFSLSGSVLSWQAVSYNGEECRSLLTHSLTEKYYLINRFYKYPIVFLIQKHK